MIVIDTDVVSQPLRPAGDKNVLSWLDLHGSEIRITAVSVMEVRRGLELMKDGHRRRSIASEWSNMFDARFADHVLPFDNEAAEIAGRLMAQRALRGITIDLADTQIAAIAIAHGASIATRNTRHFADLPIAVIDPWTA